MNINNLTHVQVDEIADLVAGGCQDQLGEDALRELGIDPDLLDEVCAKVEVYKCPNCCWWGHSGEILEHTSSNDESICEDCFNEENEEV
jgi:hypothetical protein